MKVVIVHGCPSNVEKAMDPEKRTYDKHWIPWIKEKLEKKEINVYVPLMPEPWAPVYEDWKKEFDKLKFSKDTILIGHSCGCAFLVRWLGETKRRIKKLILVAPAITNRRKERWELEDFYNFKIDRSVSERAENIILFQSDDDEKSILESCKIYSKELNISPIVLKSKGHFTQGDMRTNEFPELLQEVLKTK